MYDMHKGIYTNSGSSITKISQPRGPNNGPGQSGTVDTKVWGLGPKDSQERFYQDMERKSNYLNASKLDREQKIKDRKIYGDGFTGTRRIIGDIRNVDSYTDYDGERWYYNSEDRNKYMRDNYNRYEWNKLSNKLKSGSPLSQGEWMMYRWGGAIHPGDAIPLGTVLNEDNSTARLVY